MITMTMVGAPYHNGDRLEIAGQPCQVVEIERMPDPQPFGLHWFVIAARASDGAWLKVTVNDDGRNHNTRCPVGPSDTVED